MYVANNVTVYKDFLVKGKDGKSVCKIFIVNVVSL